MPADKHASPSGVAKVASYQHFSEANGFIFVAGQVARDANGDWVGINDISAQARQVWKNIGIILAQAGAEPGHIVKVSTFLIDRAHGAISTQARLEFLGDHRPPHSGVIVAGLGSEEAMIEVEVIAWRPPNAA
ncbi:MAG: RidA family protein [Roseinatronobacter sp.]